MGFGCNAVGVTGCRIISSKRERVIAMVTNSLIPCNGRFPTLIALITMFMTFGAAALGGAVSALVLLTLILVSIFATLLISKLLSKTLLKGEGSAFVLELPPYRAPKVWSVIVRSVFDRTLFVLGRAVAVAAPAGLVIWILANVRVGNGSLLVGISSFLDPIGRLFAMDGAILLAFILALPAGEIFIPILLMIYTGGGSLVEYGSIAQLRHILTLNGWTTVTAIAVAVFTLFHFPCSTTLMTIKRESGKWRWAAVAAAVPTAFGVLICLTLKLVSEIFSSVL